MKGKCSEINQIRRTDNIRIYNILRDLGLKCSIKGTTLMNKAIQFVIISSEDFILIDNIYEEVAKYYKDINAMQVKSYIKYALKNRDEEKCKKNFYNVFGFEYDKYIFTNKNIIEEIARII